MTRSDLKQLVAGGAAVVGSIAGAAATRAAQGPPDPPKVRAADPPRAEDAHFTFVEDRPRDELLTLVPGGPTDPSTLRVRLTTSAQTIWLLPAYHVGAVALPSATDAAPVVRIVLRDALYDNGLDAAITRAMTLEYGKGGWKKAVPTGNRVVVTLRVKDGDREERLGTVRVLREVGQKELELAFRLTTAAAVRVRAVRPADLGLTFEETYYGRFTDPDLEAAVSVGTSAATDFANKLGATRKGERAVLLAAVGGGVNNRVTVQQVLGRQIRMEVLTAHDKSVNPQLVDSIVAKLFAGVAEETTLAKAKDDTAVTFLMANGLRATASIGTFKGLREQWKKDRDELYKQAATRKDKGRDKIGGELSAEAFEVFSSTIKFDYETEHDRESSDSFESHVRAMDEVMKAIDGELPVAVLNADQVQRVATRASSLTEIRTGSFRYGQKLMVHNQSLAAYFEPKPQSVEVARQPAPIDPERAKLERARKTKLAALEEVVAVLAPPADATTAVAGAAAEHKVLLANACWPENFRGMQAWEKHLQVKKYKRPADDWGPWMNAANPNFGGKTPFAVKADAEKAGAQAEQKFGGHLAALDMHLGGVTAQIARCNELAAELAKLDARLAKPDEAPADLKGKLDRLAKLSAAVTTNTKAIRDAHAAVINASAFVWHTDGWKSWDGHAQRAGAKMFPHVGDHITGHMAWANPDQGGKSANTALDETRGLIKEAEETMKAKAAELDTYFAESAKQLKEVRKALDALKE